MALNNLKVVNGKRTVQSRAQTAIESYARSKELAAAPHVSIRKGRHLDVDEVLARSLPSLTVKGLDSGQEKILGRI